ncbi:hypothetical protein BX616_004381 [Lobosporangium transversale]|uniref:Uncharacterized protein n=1 Tax=Lobosporangium transversale TaxID=64571 RepID=A0A1Y2GTX6_9FUNG|nr:hypothetical protein BCR41DRAFT_370065 [Lobosporangium transversale]KAF9898179.1 hypothetical protein BX616_004381 [Lobosporangium transversale]ORZ18254.1 hypothetical protein BCR41DRAFT_370065 [Lobosporangium transversale]|eukprot:XP_021882049.1 hypothetical protein BCR41DRAFT_370065 [Lobosporangium transversale]
MPVIDPMIPSTIHGIQGINPTVSHASEALLTYESSDNHHTRIMILYDPDSRTLRSASASIKMNTAIDLQPSVLTSTTTATASSAPTSTPALAIPPIGVLNADTTSAVTLTAAPTPLDSASVAHSAPHAITLQMAPSIYPAYMVPANMALKYELLGVAPPPVPPAPPSSPQTSQTDSSLSAASSSSPAATTTTTNTIANATSALSALQFSAGGNGGNDASNDNDSNNDNCTWTLFRTCQQKDSKLTKGLTFVALTLIIIVIYFK